MIKMPDKKEKEKVCPYNEFALCYKEGCPAYQEIHVFCKFVQDGVSPVRY